MSITNLRALVGGRVVFNTRANFVSFAILGQRRLCAYTFERPHGYVPRSAKWGNGRDCGSSNHELQALMLRYGAVLLRGSDVRSHEDFAAVSHSLNYWTPAPRPTASSASWPLRWVAPRP